MFQNPSQHAKWQVGNLEILQRVIVLAGGGLLPPGLPQLFFSDLFSYGGDLPILVQFVSHSIESLAVNNVQEEILITCTVQCSAVQCSAVPRNSGYCLRQEILVCYCSQLIREMWKAWRGKYLFLRYKIILYMNTTF